MNLLHDFLDLLLPPACPRCGRRISRAERPLCLACQMQLERVAYEGPGQHGFIERIFWGQLPIERATAMCYYHSEETRRMIHAIKYADRPDVAEALAAVWAREALSQGFFDGIEAVIPLPLHRVRQRQRGYNQSEWLARGIHRITGLPVLDGIVVRTVNNPSQTLAGRGNRRDNVEGIFTLNPAPAAQDAIHALHGRHVLLVDDVLTTGATLLSCGRALCGIPALRLSIFALAYAGELVPSIDDDDALDDPNAVVVEHHRPDGVSTEWLT